MGLTMDDPTENRFPALRSRRKPIDSAVDKARRVLWRAFQQGTLTEEEFASTLDRLGFRGGEVDPWLDRNRHAEGSPSDA